MELHVHFQTSVAVPTKFMNAYVLSSHAEKNYLSVWGLKLIHGGKRSSCLCLAQNKTKDLSRIDFVQNILIKLLLIRT